MNSVKIVHTADLHLIPPNNIADKYRRQAAADSVSVFYSIVDFCKEYEPDILLISGDLFSVPAETEAFAKQIFEKFTEIPYVKVIISPGNHDYISSSSPYKTTKLPDNVHIFSEFSHIMFKDINAAVYGAGFGRRFIKESIFKPAVNDDLINICSIHADLTNTTSEYNPISPQDIAESNYDYVALGHIHAFSGIQKAGSVSYAYPGTPQGQGFDEKGEKGVIYGSISKGSADLKFKPTSKRIFAEFNYDISDFDAPSQASASIKDCMMKNYGEAYNENFYKINLTGEHKANHSLFVDYIAENLSSSLFYCEVNDFSKPDINLLKNMVDETTLKGIYIKKMLDILENGDEDTQRTAKKALYLGLEVLDSEN